MSGCFTGPYVSAYDPPIDCAVEVYKRQEDPEMPKAWVLRGDEMVDVTGAVEYVGADDLGITIYTVDCDGNPVSQVRNTMLFDHYRLMLAGAQVGEALTIDGSPAGAVMSAGGACGSFTTLPEPSCSGMYDWSVCDGNGSGSGSGATPPENDDTGCNATGASNLCVAFALLALRRRKKN